MPRASEGVAHELLATAFSACLFGTLFLSDGVCMTPGEGLSRFMSKSLRGAFVVFSLLAACLAGAGIYSRYFDEPGGAFCRVQHEAAQLRNMKICHWTGVSMEVLTLLRTDVRNTGNPHMILIKYTGGIVYQCFWFDDREFDYWI
jgi:hypothetical protein